MSKSIKLDPATDPLIPLFKSIGLSQAKAQEAAKSPKSAAILKDIIDGYPQIAKGDLDEKRASLTVALAGALAKSETVGLAERDHIITTIIEGNLKTTDQVAGMPKMTHNFGDTDVLCKLLSSMPKLTKHHSMKATSIRNVELVRHKKNIQGSSFCLHFAW